MNGLLSVELTSLYRCFSFMTKLCIWGACSTVGCSKPGAGGEAEAPSGDAQPSTSESTLGEPSDSSPGPNQEPEATTPPSTKTETSEEPLPKELVAEVCEANCLRMDSACAPSAKICRASCDDYVEQAERCPVEIYEALKCQTQAEDFMLCSNVSPQPCASLVIAMQDCRKGRTPARVWGESAAEPEQSSGVPAGWARLSHPQQGFSILLPAGAAWKFDDGFEQASVKNDGVDYRARIVSLGGKKLSDGLILRTVVAEVGPACESKLRIHGRYESKGTEHIRFNTPCKGEQDYYGGLYIRGDRAVLVTMHREGSFDDPPAHLDELVFGYQEP